MSGVISASHAQNAPPPAHAVHVGGQYNAASIAGIGFGAADLPFQNGCANQTSNYAGKIVFDIKHYSGDGMAIFRMQTDTEEQQRVAA